jgi:hypothetical protein
LQHAQRSPSYIGQQLFYNLYLNTFDYNIRLSPKDVGPNLTTMVELVREVLQPNPQESEYMKAHVGNFYNQGVPRDFALANLLPFTTDELMNRVFASPNWEYYLLLCLADDRIILNAALEIARAYPDLIIRYFLRNLYHFMFDPGYAHTRFNLNPFGQIGLHFYPAVGELDAHELTVFKAQAAREVSFNPLPRQPDMVRYLFSEIHRGWENYFHREALRIVGVLMCVAWAAAFAGLTHMLFSQRSRLTPQSEFRRINVLAFADSRFVTCVIITSLLLGYNAAVTAMFAEPDFRYRDMAELQADLIAGFGLFSIQQLVGSIFIPIIGSESAKKLARAVSFLRSLDIFQRFTTHQTAAFTIVMVLIVMVWWIIFMLQNTTACWIGACPAPA